MSKCVIIKNKCLFRWQIKRHLSKGKKNCYLALRHLSFDEEHFLAQEGIIEAGLEFSEDAREQFLKEYISLIGAAGVEQNHLLWWATDIASKNRFTSKLESLLEKYWVALKVFDGAKGDCLLLIVPPWPIERVLRMALKQEGVLDKAWDVFQFVYFLLRAVVYKLCFCIWSGMKISSRIFIVRWYLTAKIKSRLKISSVYDVIKSFVFKGSFNGQGVYQDNYFGVLPEALAVRGYFFILAVILVDFKECLKKIKRNTSTIIIPIEYFLRIKDVWQYAWKYFCYFPKIQGPVLLRDKDVTDILNKELIRSAYKIQLFQLLHYSAIKRMLTEISLKTFVMTFENNPWEQMCTAAIKETQPSVKVIGYSHNVIPQASANMFISREEKSVASLPDKILTTGEEPKRIMEYYGYLDHESIQAACGLRFQYLLDKPLSQRRPIQNILLALEGIKDVRYLVDYALKELKQQLRYQMTIRTHPVLPWSYFVQKYGYNFQAYPNVIISDKKSLYEDIQNSDVVLYWGTTVALEALSVGKPVIHFDNGSLLSYDPLFRCTALKWKVSPKNSLLDVFSKIETLSDGEYIHLQSAAKEYLRGYFKEVDSEGLNQFQ